MSRTARLPASEIVEEFLATYRLPLLFSFISLTSAVTGAVLLYKTTSIEEPLKIVEATESGVLAASTSMIVVDVAGGVNRPGVYELPLGSRIADAITAAGGLSEMADTGMLARAVNQAEKVKDGGKIFVPEKGEKPVTRSNPVQNGSDSGNASVISGIISVNNASQKELESLNGIGPKTAEKIIANRPYLSLEELVGKKVLTQSLYEKLKGELGL